MICSREGCDSPTTSSRARFCSDNCRKRAWEEENRLACIDCGEALGVRVHYDRNSPAERCKGCEKARRAAELTERCNLVARLYYDGATMKEIAAELGWNGNPGRLLDETRKRGLIGYRYRGYGQAA